MQPERDNRQIAGISTLSHVQQDMLMWLLRQDEAIKTQVVSPGQNVAEERLGIYSNAYRFRLVDTLADTYPSVHTLLGDERFYQMSCAYLDAHPSRHFSLRYFGDQLNAFLREYDPETPVLAEMAAFEWALRNAFDSADVPAIGLQDLQEIPVERWGDLCFRFHPSVQCLGLEWNTPQLWAAIDAGSEPIAVVRHEHTYTWVIWRKALLTYYRSLEVEEAWALDSALHGVSFSRLCEGVCEWVDDSDAPARVAGFISRWVDDDLLIGVSL